MVRNLFSPLGTAHFPYYNINNTFPPYPTATAVRCYLFDSLIDEHEAPPEEDVGRRAQQRA